MPVLQRARLEKQVFYIYFSRFKIVCISSIRFLRQWSFTMCSVDGSGKPCLDIDHCVMLGKASVNMFIVFSSLLNNQ